MPDFIPLFESMGVSNWCLQIPCLKRGSMYSRNLNSCRWICNAMQQSGASNHLLKCGGSEQDIL